jgi:hypothetical protein
MLETFGMLLSNSVICKTNVLFKQTITLTRCFFHLSIGVFEHAVLRK